MIYLLVILLLGVSDSGIAADTASPLKVSETNTAVIDGVIRGDNLEKVEKALLLQKPGDVLDLVINSPGGAIITGFRFISVMDAALSRGVRIRCFVPEVAASMAFQILLHCDERHVLEKSFLLWHRARVQMGGMFGRAMTFPELYVLSRSLFELDELILSEVLQYVDMDASEIEYHFENETLHIGELLARNSNAFQSHKSIPGLFEALNNKKLPRTEERSVFEMETDFDFGEIIYVQPAARQVGGK